jgi:hypothetical protein
MEFICVRFIVYVSCAVIEVNYVLFIVILYKIIYRVYKKNATSEFPKKSLCNS